MRPGIGGERIEVFYEDVCLPAPSLSALRNLLEMRRIDGLVANFCIIGLAAMQPMIELKKLLTIQPSVVPQAVIKPGGRIFSTSVPISREARRLARYAVEELGATRAAVLALETPWGIEFAREFTETVHAEIAYRGYQAIGASDFRSELVRIKAQRPDLLFLAHLGPTLGLLLRQTEELGFDIPIISVDEAEDASVLESAGTSAEGLRILVPYDPKARCSSKFEDAYLATYREAPSLLARNTYDGAVLMIAALSSCGDDRECRRESLEDVRDYCGAGGRFSIGAGHTADKGFALKQVREGRFVLERVLD